ncbi:MAG: hypothetical protein ACYSWT_09540, partial [Planctomycetota bacterium]
ELLTGMRAGVRDERGNYPGGSVLALAVRRAHEYWLKAAAPRPPVQTQQETGTAGEGPGPSPRP